MIRFKMYKELCIFSSIVQNVFIKTFQMWHEVTTFTVPDISSIVETLEFNVLDIWYNMHICVMIIRIIIINKWPNSNTDTKSKYNTVSTRVNMG